MLQEQKRLIRKFSAYFLLISWVMVLVWFLFFVFLLIFDQGRYAEEMKDLLFFTLSLSGVVLGIQLVITLIQRILDGELRGYFHSLNQEIKVVEIRFHPK